MNFTNSAFENSISEDGQNSVCQQKIQINVRGEMFETYEHTLSRFPRTLLGSQTKRTRFYNPLRQEYYFDRDKAVFNSILFYYQSNGILSKPETVSYEMFSSELKFFQLDGNYEDTDDEIDQGPVETQRNVNQSLPCVRNLNRIRRNVWRFFEQPVTPAERTYKKFSLILVVLSLVCLCLGNFAACPTESASGWARKHHFTRHKPSITISFGRQSRLYLRYGLRWSFYCDFYARRR